MILDSVIQDVFQFLKRLYIIDKKGKKIPLRINDEQRKVIELLEEGYNLIVCKSRQIGLTTIVTAYLFWKAYKSKDPITCVSLLHKQDSANEIFLKYKNYYYSLPSILRGKLQKETASCLKLPQGASCNAITAGGDGGLRSFTISLLHISELCYYQDPDEVIASAFAALNDNQVIIESTAKAFGDPMHQLIEKMQRGELEGKWKVLFFPWTEHKDYQTKASEDFSPREDEKILIQRFECTPEQLQWRRQKISEIGYAKFLTEYPATLDDVFSQKGDCYYAQEDFQSILTIPTFPMEEWYIEQPIKDVNYAIGVDVASGVGKDYSVIIVLSQKTSQPVYIYRSNKISPVLLADKIQHISTFYNKAKVLVESNNWGNTVINQLEHLNFSYFYKENGKHWETTTKSKVKMHEELKAAISKGEIPMLDELTILELKSLIINKEGLAPVSARNKNGHGDNAIALGLAWQCLRSLPMTKGYKDPILNLFNQKPTQQKAHKLGIGR